MSAAFHKWLLALLVWCLRSPRLLFLLLCISSPLPLLVVAEEHCALGLVELQIRYRSCVPKTVMALACRGSCYSYSQPDRNRPYQMERSCRCCRELGSQSGRTRMRCPNRDDPTTSKVFSVSFRLPRRCACRPCSQ
ncbi:bursicon-like [Littorina saxatilis]|uniref:bursicon-like n=1 Tax=Littorina saxatilis TaxID=31220 RepID=UPI0038B62073